MNKVFDTEDINNLYNSFTEICDFIENEVGCGKCPLYEKMCGAEDKTRVNEFCESLSRIRDIARIQKP